LKYPSSLSFKSLDVKFSKIGKLLFFTAFLFLIWCTCLLVAIAFPPELHTPYSKEIMDRDGRLMHCFLSQDQKWRLQTTENQIPKRLVDIIIWKEDKYFYKHPGVNPFAVLKSAVQNILSGKRLSGASTITMQAVKLKDPGKRTWFNKIRETYKALYWELAISKSEILSFYLSHLPFGGNVEGFRAASLIYFSKNPAQLSLAQWATLSIIPNQPSRLNPLKNPELLRIKRNQFLEKLFQDGQIRKSEFDEARLEPIFASRHPMPTKIPHLARKLFQTADNQISTSIISATQQDAEQILEANTIGLRRKGIQNAALLMAEIKSGEILAWIGNSDFNDTKNAGQVDGVEAIRSPGSTLKPFIYEMAFQKGIITPKTILYDIPVEFSTYIPENYDQEFRGKVFADNALSQSLNIPAIQLLQKVTVDSLLYILEKIGMHKLRQKSINPGLSLAVGGCGTNLFELVQAYRTLADQGNFKPLTLNVQNTNRKGIQAMETASTDMVRHILSLKNRNEALFSIGYHRENFESVAWKTGTSFGRKDAWCLGFGKKYVIGLWLGNFSGEGNPALSGIETAAPIFQKLMAHFEKNVASGSKPDLTAWKKRWVCKESGLPLGQKCVDSLIDFYLPFISSQKVCEHLKKVWVNSDESISYCVHCKPENFTKQIWIENPEPSYRAYLISKGSSFKGPVHALECPFAEASSSLRFQNPLDGKTFYLEGKPVIDMEVKIFAESDAFPVAIYNGSKKAGISQKGESVLITFGEGVQHISAVDNRGRSCQIMFFVREF